MQIYLARNNQQAGPYSLEQVNQMLASQQILLTDLAWHQGMTEWKALGELTQGQMIYQPQGYQAPITPVSENPFSQNSNASSTKNTQVIKKSELASIPARALAKIIDVLLWIPATFILTAFFSEQEQGQFTKLNEQIMQMALNGSQDTTRVLELQAQMFELIPTQAYIAAAVYLIVMLILQGYFIVKSGQSIGKKITKIKIVDAETDEKVSLMRGFTLRSIVFILPTLYFIPLFTLIDSAFVLGKKRQTLHDKLAKTKVVKQ